jgi:hypothetical protein
VDKNWRLNKYKEHQKTILYNKEMLLIPMTLSKIKQERERDDEIEEYTMTNMVNYDEIKKKNDEIENINNEIRNLRKRKHLLEENKKEIYESIAHNINNIHNLRNGKIVEIKVKKYKYKCIKAVCRGYLNEDYECDLCNIKVCSDCFIEKRDGHECDDDLVLSCKMIKKAAKPCPKCNEFIIKIEGCDQMFCVICGTAFSWKTGEIEKGIIHNPHAYSFFEKHPELRVNNNNNRCNRLPDLTTIIEINDNSVTIIYRHVSEFNQYKLDRINNYLNNEINMDLNEDLRKRYLANGISEKEMKRMIFMRYKKVNYKKLELNVIKEFVETVENILWKVVELRMESKLYGNLCKILRYIKDLIYETNNILGDLAKEHKYTNYFKIEDSLSNLIRIKI